MALSKPAIPDGAGSAVDRLLRAYFSNRKIAAPKPVSDAVFARRAYLDIWGLLPTPEQLDEFANAPSGGKRQALIHRLLSNKDNYAEHWITFWNDLLRNDEGVNYAGTRKSITGWLLPALKENLPFNQFVAQLLSPMGESAPDGFLLGVNWRGDINASQTPVMQAAQNSAQIFLGVNLKCNSCHDSFISRWKLADAYGLASFFSDDRLELVRCDVKQGRFSEPKFLYPELGSVAVTASLAERRAAAARLFTEPENGRFARTVANRIWKRLIGRGLVEPVDDMDAEPWYPELLDDLAADFVEHGYNLKYLIGEIMNSLAYQAPVFDRSPKEESEYVFRGPAVRRIDAEQFMDAISSITGEWRALVTPQVQFAIRARDWRFASSRLTRGLGRPIRDQVFTERATEATTLQALELVNGDTLTRFLVRASKRMLGELPPAPANLFDSGKVSANHVKVDIDITGAKQLRLLVADTGSYSPEPVLPLWADARLTGPDAVKELGEGRPVEMKDVKFSRALRVRAPSEQIIDLDGQGYTRFEATVGIDASSLQSDISANIRFFVFKEKPDMEQLVRASDETPVPRPAAAFTANSLVTRLYRHALSREATQKERQISLELLSARDKIPADGLADLLWSIVLLPEFQLIH